MIADRATGRAVDGSEMAADATATGERAADSVPQQAVAAAKGDVTADSDQAERTTNQRPVVDAVLAS